MKVRYRGKGIKQYAFQGKKYAIPSDSWTEINNLTLFKKLKSFPSVFDVVSYFDTKPFELIEELIEFKGNLIYTGDSLAIRTLDKIPFVRLQATKPEERLHIYKIINYDNENMSRFSDVKRTVNVLVYRELGGIGDVLMTSPIVESAYKKFPHFKITYSCPAEFLPLMENNPFVYSLKPFRNVVTKENWDVVTNLTRDCIKYEISKQPEVDLNRVEVFAEKCGFKIDDLPRPKVFLSQEEIMAAKEELKNFGGVKIGLVLESNAPVRNWPYFKQLRNRLLSMYSGACVLEFRKIRPNNWQSHSSVYPVFKRSLREVMALINECDVVVTPDTGLGHIASCLRIPTIWIFTHIDGKVRTKNYDNVWVLQKTPANCPKGKKCWYEIPCRASNEQNPELKVEPACATAISVDNVIGAIVEVLGKPNLSYVVVYKDQKEITEKCLGLIREYKKRNEEIVLVDNGSIEKISFKDHGDTKFINNESNLGCILGRNQGMHAANGRFLLTLDNDQYISPATVHRLMATEGDVVGCEGWSMDTRGWAFDIKENRGKLAYVGGGGCLVRRRDAESVGFLSEEYAPAWFSDPDFCFKARQKGLRVGYCKEAGIEHLKHKTVLYQNDFDPNKAWHRSHEIFVKKWRKFLESENEVVSASDIKMVIARNKPIILFSMLSWLRYDYLIRTLDNLSNTLRLPTFFYLRVQGSERVDNSMKSQIEALCSRFMEHQIDYTYNNQGTALPRKQMIKDFVTKYSEINYICLADDDVTFSDYSVEKAVAFLEKNKEIGGVGIPHKLWGFYLRDNNSRRVLARADLNSEVTYVDVLGSGHSIFRKDAFRKVEIDEEYFVGAWDWDLTLQMTTSDSWKLVILNLPGMKANNEGGGPNEYIKVRSDKVRQREVITRFNKKFRLGDFGLNENSMANN